MNGIQKKVCDITKISSYISFHGHLSIQGHLLMHLQLVSSVAAIFRALKQGPF